MENGIVTNKLKMIGLMLYFVILPFERFLAVIFSIGYGNAYALNSGLPFSVITYFVTLISLIVGLGLSVFPFWSMLFKLFSKKPYPFEKRYKIIVIAAMAFLYGGMMHTGFTLAPVQFIAYGFLIASMVVRTVEKCKEDKSKSFASIVSVIYLTLFSMTVPVCYLAFELGSLTIPFYVSEFLAAFVLIPVFGVMLYNFFKDGVAGFSVVPPILMFILSGASVAFKWSFEINYFVLVFMILTLIFYLSFGIIAKIKIKKMK